MTNEELFDVEYEATFYNINPEEIRSKIKGLGGLLIKPKFDQVRTTFTFPKGHEIEGGFIRVRDEAGKITMTLKIFKENGLIDGQKEIELVVDNYENAVNFLKTLGAEDKAIQETKREIWSLNDVEIMIDWWPFLEPFVEIEGKNESDVRNISEKFGFDWKDAVFDGAAYFYSKKYGLSKDVINNQTPKILFDMENPFLCK